MLYRTAVYLIGFGLSAVGGINIIAYLNLLSMGYSYSYYFLYIGRRPECYLAIAGLILIWFSVYGFNPEE
ncbi:hypothetical protein J6TS1_36690 [Siminovitchia terrae]|uniref:Uncharacterized protein n=1 Tax=Siminovitchia terrae TaxID=1914933 RepID=A0A429X8C9_SIMTE|nr:hypothetical protein [Siminovitchia terrae]RST59642.1 hypothetical protein D5F11_011075 [Siminovitchia terrae]GIN89922.1 hypothetical protein J22TS1_09730 [Siminovitchia terrae]GIN97799.1 hypothetical protein J6TS1_36690 [Siminovitchia terrae]